MDSISLLTDSESKKQVETITLKSSDGQSFQIDKQSASKSKLINDLLLDYKKETDIPLPEVEGKILKKIVEYLIHYKNSEPKEIEKPLKDSNLSKVIDEWDLKYITNFLLSDCIDLINAANYMDISGLLNLACARIAAKMIELPVEETRKVFGIENDMTPEETKEYDKYPLSIE